jgi:phosphatidylserine decarboxylase
MNQLMALIEEHCWHSCFEEAVSAARCKGVEMVNNKFRNATEYFEFMNELLYWVPFETFDGKEVYNRIVIFYFVFNQPTLKVLQNFASLVPSILPDHKAPPLRPLSKWLVDYANAMGEFMDTPESLTPATLKTFENASRYNMKEYIYPRGGWKSFNQFFARHFKPGTHPIAAIGDPTVIVSPADSTFAGQWEIRQDSQVTFKTLPWHVQELLEGSPYKNRFEGGVFMHSFLNTNDYHRQHAPVGGTVLEARVIQGLVYLEVNMKEVKDADGKLVKHLYGSRTLDAPDTPGYQFAQSRGLIVLDTPIGLVAVLPIGMAQVSSVVITADVGVTVQKGEELSYFQFGGSDICVLFERKSNVSFTARPEVHYRVGARIAQAYPAV